MNKLIPCLLTLFLTTSAKAQLIIKNTKTDTLQVAIVMLRDTKEFSGWVSKGWYKLNPNDSGAIGPLSGASIYYFIQTTDNKVSTGGSKAFLVDPKNPFTINGADLKSNHQENLKWQDFVEVKIPEKATKDGRLMILL